MPKPPRQIALTWLILLALLGGNIILAYAGLGVAAPVIHVALAAAMAALVLVVFMELDRGASLFWVFAGAEFFWLAILLFALTAADYLTRYNFAVTAVVEPAFLSPNCIEQKQPDFARKLRPSGKAARSEASNGLSLRRPRASPATAAKQMVAISAVGAIQPPGECGWNRRSRPP